MRDTVAGIDVHKKVPMVVAIDFDTPEQPERRRFGTTCSELSRLRIWLQEQGVAEAVMESTAQYWRPVWMELEPHLKLHLAQAFSNKAPRGHKHDFKDAERLVRRLKASELILSFVPAPEQRTWRTITRMKWQLRGDRVRLQNQLECLLEEMRIKLSSVVGDLLGASGRHNLRALAEGETDAGKLAELGDRRLHCTRGQLIDALTGNVQPLHQRLLALYLERLEVIDAQLEKLTEIGMDAHQDAVARLAEVPGLGTDSAQQVIAEVGAKASAFASPAHLASWAGTCPGKEESAEQNQSSRSAKGNRYPSLLRQGSPTANRPSSALFLCSNHDGILVLAPTLMPEGNSGCLHSLRIFPAICDLHYRLLSLFPATKADFKVSCMKSKGS